MYSRVRNILILRHLLRGLRVVFTTARLQTEVSSGVGRLKLHGSVAQSYNTYNTEKLLSAEVEVRTRCFIVSCPVDSNTILSTATPSALAAKLNCSFLSTLHRLALRHPIQKGSFSRRCPILDGAPSRTPLI